MVRPAMTALLLACLAGTANAEEKEVKHTLHVPGYYESNKSGLSGPASYLVFKERADFDAVFLSSRLPGKKAKLLPKGAFKDHIVVATIKRGDAVFTYEVTKVT